MGAPCQTRWSALQGGCVVIFVTVGEQLPFDRLIRAMDQYAGRSGQDVVAQVGRSAYRPVHLRTSDFLDQEAFLRRLRECSLIVAHAGMGTIISALELDRPIIVMPRQASLGEHRNDHQLATARRFATLRYVRVVNDSSELWCAIDDMLADSESVQHERKRIEPHPELIGTIRNFILTGQKEK